MNVLSMEPLRVKAVWPTPSRDQIGLFEFEARSGSFDVALGAGGVVVGSEKV
jgi:hypothetical protein